MPVPSSTAVVFVSESVLADFLSGKTLPSLASDPLPTKGIFKSALMNHMSSGALGLGPAILFLSKPFTCRPSGSFPCGEVGVEWDLSMGLPRGPSQGQGGPLSKCLTCGSFGRGTSLLAGPVACGQAPLLREKAGSWRGGLFPL